MTLSKERTNKGFAILLPNDKIWRARVFPFKADADWAMKAKNSSVLSGSKVVKVTQTITILEIVE